MKLLLLSVQILVLFAFTPGFASAQVYPARPVRMIVPYPPGGGTDIVVRLVAAKLAEYLGQAAVVENRPGASTIIGTDLVSKAAPDGYTVGVITDSHSINPNFFKKLPYDSLKDFEPISQLVVAPFLLVAHPSLQAKTVKELIAAARARPGKLNFASVGPGSPHHLAMEWVKVLAGIDMVHVPYKGTMAAYGDLLAGQVGVMFTGIPTGMPNVRRGQLEALAVSSAKRQPSVPEIPTVGESGLPEFELVGWYGTAAPAGTPKEIVSRLSREISRALDQTDVRERLDSMGLEPAASAPASFAAFMVKDAAKYAHIIKITGAKSSN